jgi:hypothetical protein
MNNTERLLDRLRLPLQGKERQHLLRSLIAGRLPAYRHARALHRLAEYATYLAVALYIGMDDDEKESIEVAELAYAALTESMQQGTGEPYEMIRHRILLLHRFADYLTDSWMEVFMKKYKESHLLQARSLALDSLVWMQLADARDLDRDFREQFDADDALNAICNTIHLPESPSEQELSDASLMHKVFHAYLKVKYAL